MQGYKRKYVGHVSISVGVIYNKREMNNGFVSRLLKFINHPRIDIGGDNLRTSTHLSSSGKRGIAKEDN